MAILITIVVIFKRNKITNFFKWARCRPFCRSSDAELGGHTESIMLDDIKTPRNVVPLGGMYFSCTLLST